MEDRSFEAVSRFILNSEITCRMLQFSKSTTTSTNNNTRISDQLPPSERDAVWGLKISVQDMRTLTQAPALYHLTLPVNPLTACSMNFGLWVDRVVRLSPSYFRHT